MLNELILFLIPLFWTGQGPIPYPDCVELVDSYTVILHRDSSVIGCGYDEEAKNLTYFYSRGYRITSDHIIDSERGEMTLTKSAN